MPYHELHTGILLRHQDQITTEYSIFARLKSHRISPTPPRKGKDSLYHYFKSKEEIFQAVIEKKTGGFKVETHISHTAGVVSTFF